ncbi:MAG: hypothetical protein Fues2KO_12110 [Fuerstiella sp.]
MNSTGPTTASVDEPLLVPLNDADATADKPPPTLKDDPRPAEDRLTSEPIPSGFQPPLNVTDCGEEVCLDTPAAEEVTMRNLFQLSRGPYQSYRTDEDYIAWLPGNGDDFGMVHWKSDPYLEMDEDRGFTSAFNMHWLNGPTVVPLPPRVYEFVFGYHARDRISSRFSYDMFTSIGVYSDFEGSAREGVRFPAHAAGILHVNQSTDVVFGIDYLGRDNIGVLPVFGVSLHDLAIDGLRLDLVFPRPRIDYVLSNQYQLYLTGQTAGGDWDIEFPGGSGEVMSYRDYRIAFGLERSDDDGDLHSLELGYVFGRNLELRGRPGDFDFDDAFLIRWVTRK